MLSWSILQYFGPALSIIGLENQFLVLFLSGRLRQVLLYSCHYIYATILPLFALFHTLHQNTTFVPGGFIKRSILVSKEGIKFISYSVQSVLIRSNTVSLPIHGNVCQSMTLCANPWKYVSIHGNMPQLNNFV